MAESEISRIVDQLDREHAGDPWHGSPLRQILDGVDHVRALARPFADGHTIWELVLHITAWKNEVRSRLGGAPAGDPPEGDWPPLPADPGPRAWSETIDALERAHKTLVAAVERFPEASLYSPSKDPRNRETGAGVSYYVLLHGMVQHDVYHSGQIAILKKALAGPASAAR